MCGDMGMQRQSVFLAHKSPAEHILRVARLEKQPQLFIRLKRRVGNKGLPKICASSQVTQADCFSSNIDTEIE